MKGRDGEANSESRRGKIASIGLGIFHMILSLEICLPNYVLLSPILKMSCFPQRNSEVQLRRELVENHVYWNMEDETSSGIKVAKKKAPNYFNLKK